jgi:hypothetical protein
MSLVVTDAFLSGPPELTTARPPGNPGGPGGGQPGVVIVVGLIRITQLPYPARAEIGQREQVVPGGAGNNGPASTPSSDQRTVKVNPLPKPIASFGLRAEVA